MYLAVEEEIKNLQKLQEKYITVKTDFENKLRVANGYKDEYAQFKYSLS